MTIVFDETVRLRELSVVMGGADHSGDYIHDGALQVARNYAPDADDHCADFETVAQVSSPEVTWRGESVLAQCARIRMEQPQKEWVRILQIRAEVEG